MTEGATLALLGGSPVIDGELPAYRSIGPAEQAAVAEVMASGSLSAFYGSWGPEFLGGQKVRAFEETLAQRFGARQAITVNSNTSGLDASMGAIGIGPGDEVITTPWTMSATAMAPLRWGAVPVFADIEADTFGLDPAAVEAAITPRTRAILVTHLFGHPARMHELRQVADRYKIALVEDAAQSLLAHDESGRLCGTLGDIGVLSFNYHKHIHTGEGGACLTSDPTLARRLQLLRNHAEAVVEQAGVNDLVNMIGSNFRMTEMQAAVGLAQLAEIDTHVGRRRHLAETLSLAVTGLDGLTAPAVRPGCKHAYYCWALKVDSDALGVSRHTFSAALAAEGFPHAQAYLRPLYLLPIFQHRIGMGRDGFPFNTSPVKYEAGMCPVVERMHYREILIFEPCAYDADDALATRLGDCLIKVYENLPALRAWESRQSENPRGPT